MSSESAHDDIYFLFCGGTEELNDAAKDGWRVVHVSNISYYSSGVQINALLERTPQEDTK